MWLKCYEQKVVRNMARLYIDGDEARFTRRDLCLVDMEFYDGRKEEGLEPRRLFPLSGLMKYISLLDCDGKEHAIIRNVEHLMPESREVILQALNEYYLIPKITAIVDSSEKYGILKWVVDTDRGRQSLSIRNRFSDIKVLYDGRVLIRDTDDNRYEIPDYRKLDKKSLVFLNSEI